MNDSFSVKTEAITTLGDNITENGEFQISGPVEETRCLVV